MKGQEGRRSRYSWGTPTVLDSCTIIEFIWAHNGPIFFFVTYLHRQSTVNCTKSSDLVVYAVLGKIHRRKQRLCLTVQSIFRHFLPLAQNFFFETCNSLDVQFTFFCNAQKPNTEYRLLVYHIITSDCRLNSLCIKSTLS